MFYGLIWAIAGRETAGMRFTDLQLITFDGFPLDARSRALRFASTGLAFVPADWVCCGQWPMRKTSPGTIIFRRPSPPSAKCRALSSSSGGRRSGFSIYSQAASSFAGSGLKKAGPTFRMPFRAPGLRFFPLSLTIGFCRFIRYRPKITPDREWAAQRPRVTSIPAKPVGFSGPGDPGAASVSSGKNKWHFSRPDQTPADGEDRQRYRAGKTASGTGCLWMSGAGYAGRDAICFTVGVPHCRIVRVSSARMRSRTFSTPAWPKALNPQYVGPPDPHLRVRRAPVL